MGTRFKVISLYEWLINILKDVQHDYSLGKCKSKPLHMHKNGYDRDFPVGAVVKNLAGGHMVSTLVREDPTCHATKPVQQGPSTQLLKPKLWSLQDTTTEAHVPRVCALQQEKPPQWAAHTTQPERSPCLLQLGKVHPQQRRPSNEHPKLNNF